MATNVTTTIREKVRDIFRNLTSDAVQTPPRSQVSEEQESESDVTNTQETPNYEEYVEEDEEEIINVKGFKGTENAKKKYFGSSKKKDDLPKLEKKKKGHTDYNNVQTHGRYPYNI